MESEGSSMGAENTGESVVSQATSVENVNNTAEVIMTENVSYFSEPSHAVDFNSNRLNRMRSAYVKIDNDALHEVRKSLAEIIGEADLALNKIG